MDRDYSENIIEQFYQKYKSSGEGNHLIHYTGANGMASYDLLFKLELEKRNNRDFTDFLYDNKTITLEEKETILNMIDSKDKENYEVAKLILDFKSKNSDKWKSRTF